MGKNQSASNLTNIIQYNNGNISFVSGSTTLMQISSSGAITITGVISGSTTLSSSFATTASYAVSATSASYSLNSTSASYALNATSASNSTLLANRDVAQFATTASNVYYGNQIVSASVLVSGSITATGQIVAQTINVQSVTSSIVYSSGSNVFGNRISDTQTFTGSMLISGSVNAVGAICTVGTVCAGSVCAPSHIGGTFSGTVIYGSSAICGGVISGSGALLTGALSGTSATFSGNIDLNGGELNINYDKAIRWKNSGGTLRQIIAYADDLYIDSRDGGINFRTGTGGSATTRLTISSTGAATFSGNVGIGEAARTTSTLVINNTNAKNELTFGGSEFTNIYSETTSGIQFGIVSSGNSAAIEFLTNNAERMRITSGGNVGIGVTSPGARFHVTATNPTRGIIGIITNDATSSHTGAQLQFTQNSVADWVIGQPAATDAFAIWSGRYPSADGTERMRITSAGCVGIGTCAPNARLSVQNTDNNLMISVLGTNANARLYIGTDGSSNPYLRSQNSLPLYLGVDSTNVLYVNSGGSTVVGTSVNATESAAQLFLAGSGYSGIHWLDATAYYIGQNSSLRELRLWSGAASAGVRLTNGATSWTSYSDERIKTNIENIDCVLDKIDNLRTVKYHLKDIDSNDRQKRYGLIAQDLVGKFDEVLDLSKYSDENPTKYYGIRYTELVPVLVKAIQELKCENDIFKTCLGIA